MLSLASVTDPGWAARAAAAPDLLLLDHAHCEKKAASTAVSLVFRYPEVPGLPVALSRIAREELEHFERVTEACARRGIPFRRLPPSPYAGRLARAVRTFEPARLLDTLVACALIEARSCERMAILAEALPDPELRDLYGGLLESEARHHASYLDLARATGLHSAAEVRDRVAAMAVHEAEILRGEPEPVRMHSR